MSTFTTYLASFGSAKTGLATVGYEQIAAGGSSLVARTTTNVYEVGGGVYGVEIVLTAGCKSLLWDTGEGTPIFAAEDMLGDFNKKVLINKRHTDPVTGKQDIYEDDDTTLLVQGDIFDDIAGGTAYNAASVGIDRADRMS